MSQDNAAKINLSGVRKTFAGGKKVVLDHVDLEIGKGESVVIIGGSGTGKSVTIKCMLGLLKPDSGSITIDGKDVNNMSASEREDINQQVGMLFQAAALFDSLPIWENVAFGLIARNQCSRHDARDIAVEKLKLVGLSPDVLDLSPSELSSGMQKRVGLARAIASNPEIIFFDEPTTGLDPIMADVINNLIVHVNQTIGATAVTITHDMKSARKIGDRIAMLYDGRIIWAGPTDAIDHSDNEYVDQFIHGRTEGPIKMVARR
ncbi:ATP-binding cassette domain-containing protein [Rhodospirillales bacterium]|jgi:phospholipid/cholesterol/gamma-HCH transport system ATP-binding protein|nr:ATP-binding cassette domain-containing protein [Rhodospirillales bacterium]